MEKVQGTRVLLNCFFWRHPYFIFILSMTHDTHRVKKQNDRSLHHTTVRVTSKLNSNNYSHY